MHQCWKFAMMRMVLMVSLLVVVVVEADTSTTTTRTKKPLKKVDTVCTQELDGSEMKICATNGTDFVSFHNECRLREANQKKGIAAFKKVALASCASSVNITNATQNRTTVEPMAIESKVLNEPQITTEDSILKLVYKVTPTTINPKKFNEIHSTTIRPVLRLVEKVPSTTVHSEEFKQNSLPTIAPLEKITTATDKVVTNTMRSMVKPVNIANQPNNVNMVSTTSTTTNITPIDETAISPKDIALNKVTMVEELTPIKFHIKKLDENTAKVIRPTEATVEEVTANGVTQIKFHIKNFDTNTSTASRPTVTTMTDITSTTTRPISKPVPVDKVSPIQPSNVNAKLSTLNISGTTPVDTTTIHPKGMPTIEDLVVEEVTSTTGLDKKTSTTIRPTKHKATSPTTNHSIDIPVNEVEPDNIHPKIVNEMEEQSIISDVEPANDEVVLIVSSKKVESSTLRPEVNEIKINFRSKSAPVIEDPTYPQASITNIPPKPEQVEARKIIPCPYVFNPVCATQGGIQTTFINECHVNAENVKTGKDWTIYKEGSCNEREIEHRSQQHKNPSESRSYNKNENFPNTPINMEHTNQQHKRPSEVREYNKNENFPNTPFNMEHTNQQHKHPSEVRSYNKNENFPNTPINMEHTNQHQNRPSEVRSHNKNENFPNTPINMEHTNQQHKRPSEVRKNENFPNTPFNMEHTNQHHNRPSEVRSYNKNENFPNTPFNMEHTNQQHRRPSEVRSYNKNENFPNTPINMEHTNQQHKLPSEVRSYNKNENFPNTPINMEHTNQHHNRPSEVRSYNKNENFPNTPINMEHTNQQHKLPSEVRSYNKNENFPNTPINMEHTNQQHRRPSEVRSHNKNENFPNTPFNMEHTNQQHKRPSEVRKNENFPNTPFNMEHTNQHHNRPSEVRSYNKNENFPNTPFNMEHSNQQHKRPSEVRKNENFPNTLFNMEHTNQLQKGPTEVHNNQNENYPNTPIEIGGGDIVYTPIIERTDYEDGPIVEHAPPSYNTPGMRNLEPNRAQLFPSYETSALKDFRPINEKYHNLPMINFGPNNEQPSPSHIAQVLSNLNPNSGLEQFLPSHSAPAMINFGLNNERQPSFSPALPKIGALYEREQSHSSNRAPAISNFGSNNEQSSAPHRAPVLSNFNSNSERQQFHPFHSAPATSNFGPNNERKQSFSFHGAQAIPNLTPMAKFVPNSEYSKPSYRAPMTSNIGPNNEKFYSSQKAADFDTNNKQFFQSHRTTAMKNIENTHHQNPLLNSHSRFISTVSYSGQPPINIPQSKFSITKRSPKYSHQSKNLPCVRVFNPVCATFSGVKSTFINECLVNAENRKTGSEWRVFSHGVCAEDYSSTSNKDIFKTTSTRSNDEKSYKTEQTYDPHVIYAPSKFQTEIIQDPYIAQNYGPLPEQINFKDTNSYLPSVQRQSNFESDKHYSSPLSGPTNFAHIPGVEFQRFEEYNSYAPLSPQEKNIEGAPKFPMGAEGVPQYAPTGPMLPNFEVSAHYKLPLLNVDEIPNKYEPFSSSEDIEPPCRPSAEKKPIRVVNENAPIDKVSICNFGAAQLPICGSYKNKLHSFGNICELLLRNILKNETWAPIYEGRCKCPEVCSIELEPICVTRNGIMETIPNKCYYERLKVQDPFSTWQYLFKGECLLSPLNPAFRRLTKPADPLTVKVPSYENTNFAFSNDANEQNTLNPPLKYPSEYRGYREIKKSSNAESQNGIVIATKTSLNAITTSSSSTTIQPVTTPTTSKPIYVSKSQPHDQITVATTTIATKANAKLIPYKKPITRFVVSAKMPNRASVYSSNPDSVIMRLAKPKAFAAVKSNSGRSFRRTSDRSWWR